MLDNIKNFLAICPLLSEIDVNINYLGEDVDNAAVESVSAEPVVKTYTDGGTIRQYFFAVALRQSFGQDAAANNAAISLLEQIGNWIELQNKVGILPTLSSGQSPISLEIFKTGWLDDNITNTAKYQLQCRLVYYQD